MSFLPTFLGGRKRARRLSVTPGAPYAPIPEDPTEPRVTEPGVLIPGRGVRWVHFALGAAVLLPWNALITAMPYFLSRLEGSGLRSTFASYLSTSFTAANFAFLAFATYTSLVAQSASRIRLSIGAIIVMFVALTASTLVPSSPGAYFAFTIVLGILLAGASSYLQCATVSLASIFGPIAMQKVMSGQAAVGVLVSLVQFASAALTIAHKSNKESGGESRSAFWFFAVGVLFLLGCIAAHSWLTSLRVYARALEPWLGGTPLLTGEEGSAVETESTMSYAPPTVATMRKVAKKNVTYYVAVAYVFVVTLAVFPPITTSIQSVHSPSTSPLFHPLIFNALHFFMFNMGDLLGRQLCTLPSFLTWKPRRLLLLSLARTVFVPLFLMCNVVVGAPTGSKPIINSDILYMLILLLFGVTNGHVSSNIMMAAPSLEHNKALLREEVDTAATMASFCLCGGLLLGSLLSFAVRGWICGCDPFQGP